MKKRQERREKECIIRQLPFIKMIDLNLNTSVLTLDVHDLAAVIKTVCYLCKDK